MIIQGLGGKLKGGSNSDRGTVDNSVMKRLNEIKATIAGDTGTSALLNAIIDGTWPVSIPEVEDSKAGDEVVGETEAESNY